ncbi:cupin domain-containing protein [Streptomyces sp. NBC_00237]|uniref:JmjC domain-containing protein n=1 Tax=Streptomyces sp. NBC_00237 TaxID=2975687 RepID=UPI00225C019D|nr:cupin domain-containing protein [Streptomyces sp. NBC_00237]MCX5202991.1 cupin domain-containing protein [Streptomyces sp. NBC_00237]
MDWFGRCVPDPEALLSTYWRKGPALFRPVDPPLDVFTAADRDAALDAGLLRVPYAGLYTAQGQIPDERFCPQRTVTGKPVDGYVDGQAVRDLIDTERATLQLRYIDQWHPQVRSLTGDFAARFGRLVEAFYFHSQPGRRGPVHRDDGDLIALQLGGAKHWQVYGGPADGHWQPVREDDPGPVLLDTIVRTGEVLYVPRGFAHTAEAVEGEPSSHLTVVIREAGTDHLRTALLERLAEGLTLPGRPLDDTALLATAAGLLDHLRKRLADVDPLDLVASARPHAFSSRPTA